MISAGWKHSCGIRTDATAVCWGDNTYGQTDTPTGKFTTITTSSQHSCGIRTDHTAVCWGNNNGPGTFDEESLEWVASYAGQADAPPGKFTTITTGSDHSCGIRTDHTAVCWGDNTYGQTDTPTGKFTTITTGSDHSCGIRTDHTAVCWGNNNGPGTFDEESLEWVASYAGQADAPPGKFTTITTGSDHSCGIRTDHTAVCWGNNDNWQVDVPSGNKFTTIATGANNYSCGIRADATAACWGGGVGGLTGDAPPGKFTTITTGSFVSCGIRTDGTLVCWGDNPYGQPDAPTGKFTTITPKRNHSCGIRTDGAVVCWGINTWGKRMHPQASSPPSPPARITRAESEQTAPRSAGATTRRADGCAIRQVHHHHHSKLPFVRDPNRRNRGLLGFQLPGPGGCALGQVHHHLHQLEHSCGIRIDGAGVCWGGWRYVRF